MGKVELIGRAGHSRAIELSRVALLKAGMASQRRALVLMTVLISSFTAQVVAAPSISAASGVLDHTASVTISGSGFGLKASAPPVVWDDASGSSLSGKWSGYWPSNNSAYNAAYRTPIRGIGLPHNHISKYIAGAHAEDLGSDAGWNVGFWKGRSFASYPQFTYASWYQRADDNWVFGISSPADDNYKVASIDDGLTGPYSGVITSNIEYNPRPTNRMATPAWHIYDGGGARFVYPDGSGWYGAAVNPMSGVWSKIEVEIKHSPGSDGYLKLWENGKLKVSYIGKTANSAETSLTFGIGGYTRSSGNINNWRYFADVYIDYSPARVVLANSSILAQATIVEPQIPSRWTDGAIDIAVNLGKFAAGQTAYLFVVNASGVPNTSGFPIVIGSEVARPNPPVAVSVS